ncbi:hypothetical protein [Streptomyces sp. NPDC093589]|uniref:hypothetical protein n=1 Tax=Streptomyces sp. NPDC093589 TaxID=3366043 RepID=UPI00382F929A
MARRARRTHRPTRPRPHRWCRPLHRGAVLLALPGLIRAATSEDVLTQLLLAATGAAALGAALLLRCSGAPHKAPAGPLLFHPGWTAFAVLVDVAAFASMARDVTHLAAYDTSAAEGTVAATTLAWVIVHTATHHKASAPAPQHADTG